MGASSGSKLKVALKDRTTDIRIHLLERYLLAPAVPKNCMTPGSPHIGDPVDALSEHGHEISLTLEVSDHDREGDQSTAAATTNLEGVQLLGRPAGRRHPAPEAVQNPCDPVRPPALDRLWTRVALCMDEQCGEIIGWERHSVAPQSHAR
jgi:hypothetical protein